MTWVIRSARLRSPTFISSTNVDIAVQQPATYPRVLIGDGKGGFTLGNDPNSTYSSTAPGGTLLAGDFNKDGNTDLFQTSSMSALFGQSAGTYTAPVVQPSPALPTSPTTASRISHTRRRRLRILAWRQATMS
jgi:hypothetical protein